MLIGSKGSRVDYAANAFCANECTEIFPKGCLNNCGWPTMSSVGDCKVADQCPCRRVTPEARKEAILKYRAEHKDVGYLISDMMNGLKEWS